MRSLAIVLLGILLMSPAFGQFVSVPNAPQPEPIGYDWSDDLHLSIESNTPEVLGQIISFTGLEDCPDGQCEIPLRPVAQAKAITRSRFVVRDGPVVRWLSRLRERIQSFRAHRASIRSARWGN